MYGPVATLTSLRRPGKRALLVEDDSVKHHLPLLVFFISSFSANCGQIEAEALPKLKPHPFGQREHTVRQLNGERAPSLLPAEIQWISEPWFRARHDENAQMPYLVYLPEKDRILMLLVTHHPTCTALIHSDDHGWTWSARKWLSADAEGRPKRGIALGLTNLGGGKLLAYPGNSAEGRWTSDDFGDTWTFFPGDHPADKRYVWNPLLIVKNAEGNGTKWFEASWKPTGVPWGSSEGFYSQAMIRSSVDEGRTWSKAVNVPQWLGVNEVSMIEAANGDLVAACRTDYPKRFAHYKLDHFGGLAVSISKDRGRTWSKPEPLYEWGRHHPSMVLLPGGDILMTYVVRLGYPATHEGFPQFGVEGIVSHDNGKTWDKSHRYILASWVGNITGPHAWFCSVQSTSTVLLPDGMLLTAFGTGFRNTPDTKVCKMDVALVRWRIDSGRQKTQPHRE